MESLNITLLTSSENELKTIHKEELEQLRKNEFIFNCLKKLTIEDFPHDLNENSKKNIEKALLSARISEYLDLGDGQTLLGLESFKLANIKLSYMERKMIKDRVDNLVAKEVSKKSQYTLDAEIDKQRNKFIELTKKNCELISTLEQLKRKELDLLKEVTEMFLGSDQLEIVKSLLEEAELEEARVKLACDKNEEFLLEQTSKSKHVYIELSAHLDELIRKKNRQS